MAYSSGGTRRVNRQSASHQHQSQFNIDNSPYGTYEGFDMDQSQSYNQQYYSGYSVYDQQSPQLFEDTSNQFVPQQHDYFTQQQQQTNFPQAYGNANNFINQQVLMAGQQLLTNPMAAAAIDHYSQSIVNKGKSWVGQNLKYYFAVNTAYVLKKLLLLFFPYSHKDWSIKYNTDEPVAPKDDLNAPDLYIPTMAFVTYILVAGYFLGLENKFSPEQIGIQASFALAWLLLEVIIVLISFYLLNISSSLGFFHMISYGGYKFVCIVASLLASLVFQRFGYYSVLIYSSLSLGFFLMRSLYITIQTVHSNDKIQTKEPRNALYLVLIICFLQPISMYILTRHLFISASI